MINSPQQRWKFWLGVGIGLLLFIYLIRSILLPFVLGIFIAYFLNPLANRLERVGVRRTFATLMVLSVFFLIMMLLAVVIAPVVVSQMSELIAALPATIDQVQTHYVPLLHTWLGDHLPRNYAESMKTAGAELSGSVIKIAGGFITGLFFSSIAFINLLSLILITPVVAFYMLNDWHKIVTRIDNLIPRPYVATVREQVGIINRTLAGFLHGQLNVCLMLAAYYAVGLTLTGLQFGAVIGLISGFLVIFPYVGITVGAIVGCIIAFFQFDDHSYVLIVLGVFLSGQIIESNFVTPKLVGEKVGLHPVWIIFGMLAGATLFGFVGILLAVPATAIVGVLTRFAVQKYLNSGYYRGDRKIKA